MAGPEAACNNQGCDAAGHELGTSDLNPADYLDDPTLAQCCIDDLRSQRRTQNLKEKLLSVDPTTARLKLYAAAIGPSTAQLQQKEDSDSEGAHVYMLLHLRSVISWLHPA